MRAQGPTVTSADYDAVSRFAVRLGGFRSAGAPVLMAVLSVTIALIVVVAVVPSNLGASPFGIRLASVTVGALFVVAGLVGVAQRPAEPGRAAARAHGSQVPSAQSDRTR